MSLIEKLRKPKIFDMALFDWVSSILLTLYISYKYNNDKYDNIIFIKSLIIMIILAVSIHYIFNINTKFNYYLGLNDNPKR
jgi:hypothetical protein